ncbi:MAG: biotin-dependent carboxyltransferase family protein [Gemmatimonadaceae bacterium]
MITVVSAPPFATIQDLGRFGFRDSGVPVSGLADRDSGLALNAMLGNDPNAAMIEWAVAGGALRLERDATIAFGGADAICSLNGTSLQARTVYRVPRSSELHVERIMRGRFLLIAVAGGIDVPLVLGSRSTLLSARIGGVEGRRLRTGDSIATGASASGIDGDSLVAAGSRIAGPIHVSRGPQSDLFDDLGWSKFLGTEFTVSNASDRVGYRLDGLALSHKGDVAMPSEPTCIGAIQVPNGGTPIVIMNDGPTVGGYPKIAVICKSEISRFAQLAPGEKLSFELTR